MAQSRMSKLRGRGCKPAESGIKEHLIKHSNPDDIVIDTDGSVTTNKGEDRDSWSISMDAPSTASMEPLPQPHTA